MTAIIVVVPFLQELAEKSHRPSGQHGGSITSYPIIEEVTVTNFSNPTNDCAMAFEKGIDTFLGFYGFSTTIPGLEGLAKQLEMDIHSAHQYRIIAGTSDVITDKNEEVNRLAPVYAEAYNRFLINLLEARGNLTNTTVGRNGPRN